jgi:hypothetical protein
MGMGMRGNSSTTSITSSHDLGVDGQGIPSLGIEPTTILPRPYSEVRNMKKSVGWKAGGLSSVLLVNRFQLQEKIGSGSFGEVFRARDTLTEEVRIKI